MLAPWDKALPLWKIALTSYSTLDATHHGWAWLPCLQKKAHEHGSNPKTHAAAKAFTLVTIEAQRHLRTTAPHMDGPKGPVIETRPASRELHCGTMGTPRKGALSRLGPEKKRGGLEAGTLNAQK